MNRSLLIQAAKISTPVFFGYIAIGIPFGLMLVDAGYPWWMSPLMSIVMYAGAGQYAAVGLFAAGADISTVILTMLAINIRHIVYGLSLIEKFKGIGAWKQYIAFALTDETYVLLTNCPIPPHAPPGPFYGTIAVLNHCYWIFGGLIGAVAGMLIPFSFEGVDFALTSLFIVLLIDQLRSTKNPLPPIIGGACALIALFIIGAGNMLIAGIAFGIAVLVLMRKPIEKRQREETHGK